MNMKDLVTAHATLFRSEASNVSSLILVTTAGVISGVPMFADSVKIQPGEEAEIRILATLGKISVKKTDLLGDENVLVLRDVKIQQGQVTLSLPCSVVRYDSVIACAVSSDSCFSLKIS